MYLWCMKTKKSQKQKKREAELPGLKQVDYHKIVADLKREALAAQKKVKDAAKKR